MTQSGSEPGSPTVGELVRTFVAIAGALMAAFLVTIFLAVVAYGVGDAYDVSGPLAHMLFPGALLAGFVVFILLLRSSLRRRR